MTRLERPAERARVGLDRGGFLSGCWELVVAAQMLADGRGDGGDGDDLCSIDQLYAVRRSMPERFPIPRSLRLRAYHREARSPARPRQELAHAQSPSSDCKGRPVHSSADILQRECQNACPSWIDAARAVTRYDDLEVLSSKNRR